MKKKILAILACAAMCLGLCGCESSGDSDWDYIKNKGTLVVGITYNMPMNYKDDSGELTGFETDFTTEVCKRLGVEPKFQPIEWSKKEMELKSKTIDLVWNGLTV
ncbi:MAG: transporter substrate-binding domain-containing protein, partial [Oscillospiraceae bacterium]|nr:transporter substrate-binding domain-containing protein [Oscillospiraceae bacterium]